MESGILSCRRATRLVSDSMDTALSVPERLELRVHLLMCKFCSRFEKQLQSIRHTVRRDPPEDQGVCLTASSKERLKKTLSRQCRPGS